MTEGDLGGQQRLQQTQLNLMYEPIPLVSRVCLCMSGEDLLVWLEFPACVTGMEIGVVGWRGVGRF